MAGRVRDPMYHVIPGDLVHPWRSLNHRMGSFNNTNISRSDQIGGSLDQCEPLIKLCAS